MIFRKSLLFSLMSVLNTRLAVEEHTMVNRKVSKEGVYIA